jgi:hypothetical protein
MAGKVTSVHVEGTSVVIRRNGKPFPSGDASLGVVSLTFAEVCAAAAVLREHAQSLLAADPVPALRALDAKEDRAALVATIDGSLGSARGRRD